MSSVRIALVLLAGADARVTRGGLTVNYFAYGSNLAERVREGRRGLRPLSQRPGIVKGQRLAFTMQTPSPREPAMASLDPDPNGECHGCCFELTLADWLRVCATEGVPVGYRVVEVPVECYDGSAQRAWSLSAVSRARADLAPSARYLGLLRDGARELGLAPEWQAKLEALVPAPGSAGAPGAAPPSALPRRADWERRRGATFV